jgi:hypothetical protein
MTSKGVAVPPELPPPPPQAARTLELISTARIVRIGHASHGSRRRCGGS